MLSLVFYLLILLILIMLGRIVKLLDDRELDTQVAAEALEAREVLNDSLEERLKEIDAYRHDLAALVMELDLEQVRAAEERQGE